MRTDIPYQIDILEAPEMPSELHMEQEILYVISGEADIISGQRHVSLKQYDLLAEDPGSEYAIRGSAECIICILKFQGAYVESRLNGRTGRFVLNSTADTSRSYGRLRFLFGRLLSFESEKHNTDSMEESAALEIFAVLADDFFEADPLSAVGKSSDDQRMRLIMQYITSHLHEECSISELSDLLYLSPAAVSRFFKKKTGVNFSEYINDLKMKEAAREVSGSDRPVSHISAELGFSNPAAFHHAFVRMYGMTPAEYRREHSAQRRENDLSGDASSMSRLKQKVRERIGISGGAEEDVARVKQTIDIRESQGRLPVRLKLITAGAAGDMNLVNVQHHILLLQQELGIEYVRFFTPFSTKLRITDGKTAGNYNYDLLDQILDFLVKARLKPCIDFGTRENRALRTLSDTIFVDREIIIFDSKELWEDAVSSLMEHILRRYGEATVSDWMFEFMDVFYIADNPAVPYSGTDSFHDAYASLYRIVKKYLPEAQVGGPGLMVSSGTEPGAVGRDYSAILDSFLEYCSSNDCRPDFISAIFHLHRQKIHEFGYDAEITILHEIKRNLSLRSMPDTKVIIVEWYSSVSSRNYLNDSCYRASYFARKLSQAAGLADMICVSIASDWVSNYFDSHSISNGGNGLLTKSGIEKPVLSLLRLILKMPDDLVSRSVCHYMTRNDRGELYILCWNFPITSDREFELSEISPSPSDAQIFIDAHNTMELNIMLRGILSQGRYSVRTETIREQEGTILGTWKQFGYEEDMEEYEVRYIRNSVYPRMSTQKQQIKGQSMSLQVILPPFSVALLTIRRIQ